MILKLLNDLHILGFYCNLVQSYYNDHMYSGAQNIFKMCRKFNSHLPFHFKNNYIKKKIIGFHTHPLPQQKRVLTVTP